MKNTDKTWDIIVVGAGAAGLMAAIQAAREGAAVLMLEHMDTAGKKLLMTGNGKCNFTNSRLFDMNEQQDGTIYHGACPAFVLPALKSFSAQDTLDFFEQLGIMSVVRNGGYYPASGQAASIRFVLLMECRRLKVQIMYEIGIQRIQKSKNKYIIETKTGEYQSKKVILATGGKSYKKTGSDGSGFLYLECFGHHIQDLVPALVPLQSKLAFFKSVAGIRAEVILKLYTGNKYAAGESGELQLTDYGISGICVFQISHYAARSLLGGQSVVVEIDFLPTIKETDLLQLLNQRFTNVYAVHKTMEQAMIGLLPDKLGVACLKEADISPHLPAQHISAEQLSRLIQKIKHFKVPIEQTRSFEQAQVTSGGVRTDEVNADTMESRLVSGLYFAGEMLDVDGICGGYNLQWAWSSGAVAGKSAARSIL